MIKKYKTTLIVSSLAILLPVIAGLILWNRLPDTIATHFGVGNVPNGWSSKAFTVFGLPGIMLGLYWLCVLGTNADPKRDRINPKMMRFVLWIIPVIACVTSALVYANALGYEANVERIMIILIGVLMIVIGNYLPKCRQSYTMGIKLPWTLESEDNWNRTHRMAGKLWVICGVVIIAAGLVKLYWVMVAAFVVMIVAPTVFSYRLHVKIK